MQNPSHWLEGADLSGEDLHDLVLPNAKLPFASLEGSNLCGTFLAQAVLDGTNLRGAQLDGAKLNFASLVGSFLDGAKMKFTELCDADLSGASLQGGELDGARLHGAKLSPSTQVDDVTWGILGEMQDEDFVGAAAVYRAIGEHFRSVSNHSEGARAYQLEMTALHLDAIHAHGLPRGRWYELLAFWSGTLVHCDRKWKWCGWAVHAWVWGYGVRPELTLLWIACLVLVFGVFIYPAVGIASDGNPALSHDRLEGLALSIVTVATLGYGNRTPAGLLGEFLGGLQALLGALLISVFVVGLATKFVHRA